MKNSEKKQPRNGSGTGNHIRVMEERTRELASPAGGDSYSGKLIPVMLFQLSNETYGIETTCIQEVLPMLDHTFIPGLPPIYKGVFSIRGSFYSLIDTGAILGLSPGKDKQYGAILMVRLWKEALIGLTAGSVQEIRMLREDETGGEIPVHFEKISHWIKWITRDQAVVLDTEKLLSRENLAINGKEKYNIPSP
jgi:chemotaxis signal transduction protein